MNDNDKSSSISGVSAVYISYYGLTEPLLHSQGLPYIKGLTEKGMAFTVLSFEKKDLQDATKIKAIRRDLSACGIDWKYLTYHSRPRALATLFDITVGFFTLLIIVLKKKVRVIHARSTVPAVMGYAVAFLLRRRFIMDTRGLMAYEYADAGTLKERSLLFKMVDSVERFFISRADGVVVLTKKIADIFSKGYVRFKRQPVNMKVIPCCVDLDSFTYNVVSGDRCIEGWPVFVYVGSIGTWYKFDEMLDFFGVAKQKWNNAKLLIISHAEHDQIYQKLKSKNIQETDVCLTRSEHDEIGKLIRQGDVGMFFCMPSFSKQASSPTKLAEYLACGLPVVVNDGVGDVAEVVRDNNVGAVIDAFSSRCYEKAVDELELFFKEEKETLGRRCRNTAQTCFDLKTAVRLYSELYDKALM